jgi:NAD(P)-dependent dehydrogenase (short-subunit alcohol dehydrogenase family)
MPTPSPSALLAASPIPDLVDAALEIPVVPSFTRIGSAVRSRTDRWTPLSTYDLTGRTVLVTGPTSGLGLAAAIRLAASGATLVLLGRDPARTRRAAARVVSASGNDRVDPVVADMADLDMVRAAAETVRDRHDRLDVLLHNAGALSSDRQVAPDGAELTVAAQVYGPFLLTALLLEPLRAARPGRVITMASGGLYSAGLRVDDLEMGAGYRGTEQYARAKRAQVTLNETWAQRVDPREVVFHAVHPGWADTPGVATALPTFRRVVGPLLRSADEGADTAVWLAADDGEPRTSTGGFWLDRRRRSLHRLPTTARTDTAERREQLWDRCIRATGLDPADLP